MTMRHFVPAIFVACGFAAALAVPATAMGQQEYELQGGKWVKMPAPAIGTAEGELAAIRHMVDTGRGAAVEHAAKDFLKRWTDSAAREEAMMLAAQAQINRGRLFQAYEWFEKQLGEFPDGRFSNRALDREFKIAEAFLAGKKRIAAGIFLLPAQDEGLDILSRIAEHVPGTPLAEKALLRIADYHYDKEDYVKSSDAFDHYLDLFPKSQLAQEAMLKAANATFWSFGGLAYDETPLIEAEHRYRQYAELYPISAQQANVAGILEQLRNLRAGKLLMEGELYERIRRPAAAAFVYRLLLERFPESDAAFKGETALKRLAPRLPVKAPEPAVRPAPPPPEAPSKAPPKGFQFGEVIELEKLIPATQPTKEQETR